MERKSKGLTAKEKTFCNCFVSCGSADEAAYSAGFVRNPKRSGEELLCREDIADEIKRLGKCRTSSLSEIATVGYRRLAFGKISDAVSLLYMENPSREQLEHMDLFLVSEIKRPKDGSMEIKFFDRLKALEKLTDDSEKEDRATPFYDAIAKGAEALRSETDES
ncbi:terminase small subunit [uncultured Ruminococcus sp.]|jgi:phage terminase small subunit|uniref:terminase small subunit n=1 Tax=Ruminococcus intestinalis TaxID=2763066 RepID=UPI0025EF3CE4|nr:terminase small subunit [uncultured Ruminococcus sp.]